MGCAASFTLKLWKTGGALWPSTTSSRIAGSELLPVWIFPNRTVIGSNPALNGGIPFRLARALQAHNVFGCPLLLGTARSPAPSAIGEMLLIAEEAKLSAFCCAWVFSAPEGLPPRASVAFATYQAATPADFIVATAWGVAFARLRSAAAVVQLRNGIFQRGMFMTGMVHKRSWRRGFFLFLFHRLVLVFQVSPLC